MAKNASSENLITTINDHLTVTEEQVSRLEEVFSVTLQKLLQGLYNYPKVTVFGETPPEEEVLVRSFIEDKRFLVTSLNIYNALGVGTEKLYNGKTVYKHKRYGFST